MSAFPGPPPDPAAAQQQPAAASLLPDPKPAILNAMDKCATACAMAASDNVEHAEKLAKAVLELGQGFAALQPKPPPVPPGAFNAGGGAAPGVQPPRPPRAPQPPQPPQPPRPPRAAQ